MIKKSCVYISRYGLPVLFLMVVSTAYSLESGLKKSGVLYSPQNIVTARANADKYSWADIIRKNCINAAKPWITLSDDELWEMMFGNAITRSWMVWSNGFCPNCKKSVPMYSWKINAFEHPWKVQCPHCGEFFPKNDFHTYYISGLDEHGVFNPARADRSFLYNLEHPDAGDSLHTFGVDDGEGYVEGGHRWRFIGTYLIYGQWQQVVLEGIKTLSAAYVMTGDSLYAHKAGILIDRIADLYPDFDFKKQGVVYENKGVNGYVTVWYCAREDTRVLVTAYDQIFDAIKKDTDLVRFLSRKAKKYNLDNPKKNFADIQKNIEERILIDALNNPEKVWDSFPFADILDITIRTVLGWPSNRGELESEIGTMVERCTGVDGLTGIKGLTTYAAATVSALAEFLELYDRIEPGFLSRTIAVHPNIRDTYRFYIDTWCLGEYYPRVGDDGFFGERKDHYVGVIFTKNPGLGPSMYSFFMKLYQVTGDPSYVQILYRENGNSSEGLPYDLFYEEPEKFQREVQYVIDAHGTIFSSGSVNKEKWCLGILRSGQGENARSVWLDYDSGGIHGHADGMNVGLFYKGLDLLPDFGYPPVQFGGWESPRALWYTMSAAHNTVVVDGMNQTKPYSNIISGKTTLWDIGDIFKVIKASAPQMIDGQQFERTVALIDVTDSTFYIFDVFRVIGGTDHTKFLHSYYGNVATHGLTLKPTKEYGNGTILRNFSGDKNPQIGWYADWKIDDINHFMPPGTNLYLRVTDLSTRAEAYTAEGLVTMGLYNDDREAWIPFVLTRRHTNNSPLSSTFISILEPYTESPSVISIRRLNLEDSSGIQYPDSFAAVEVEHSDKSRDIIISVDVENPLNITPSFSRSGVVIQRERKLSSNAELTFVRCDKEEVVKRIALAGGSELRVGDVEVKLIQPADYVEVILDGTTASVVSGDAGNIQYVKIKGNDIMRKR